MESETQSAWNAIVAPYRRPALAKSVWQLGNTFIPFVLLWLGMLWALTIGYWLTLLLAVPAALLLVRLFIFQHDCGHGAFFRSKRANAFVGSVIGVMTLVPYAYWRRTHALHHAGAGNLEARGFGDIDTLTAREYLGLSARRRLAYRLYRHPVVMLVIGPLYQFVVKHRFPADAPTAWKREWMGVHLTNLALLVVAILLSLAVGWQRFLLVQLPLIQISGTVGVFLFYVQHQYEDTYWRYREGWDYYEAGIAGASLFELPAVLNWFTGNIAYHHVHHVNSRVPNYNLKRCHDENAEFHRVTRLGLWDALKTLHLTLWDEDTQRLVGFRQLPAIRSRPPYAGPVQATKPEAIPRAWQPPPDAP